MKKSKITSLVLAAIMCVTFIGCSKENETPETNGSLNSVAAADKASDKEIEEKAQAESLIQINTKEEAFAFSKKYITEVESIFKKNNLEYSLTSDYRYIAYKGTYEKLGQAYNVDINAYFYPYFEQDREEAVIYSYRIPLSKNTDVTKLNVPQLNVIMDSLLVYDDKIKENFKDREELLVQLNNELHGQSTGERYFELEASNIRSEQECLVLSGGIDIAKAMIKANIKRGAEYTFDKYDDYVSIADKANNAMISAMKNAGIKDVVVNYTLGIPSGTTENYYERYYSGMNSNKEKNDFTISYELQASGIPYDVKNNKIEDTKYIKALVEALNNNEYYKNKFTYEDFMNEIYNKTEFSLKGIDTVLPSENITGLDKMEVYVDTVNNILNIKAYFSNPAVVEGQTRR